MGNTVRRITDNLRDPHLVRRIQEHFGVKQILPEADVAQGAPKTGQKRENGILAAVNGSSLTWLASKKRKRLKHPASSTGAASPPSSPESEKTHDIVVETLPVLDIFFRLATELGYEPFYITFFPFLVWNVDTTMARHIVIIWCCSMYLGQASKALFQWRRPSSPPAFRLENNPNLETEYGFPSTHAIVSTTVPFYCVYHCFSHYEASTEVVVC